MALFMSATVLAPLQRNTTTVANADTVRASSLSVSTQDSRLSGILTPEEVALFNLTNQDRATNGLPPCELDPGLVLIARSHSRDMCDRHYFDHLTPDPTPVSPMGRYLAYLGNRPSYAMVGENIFYCSATLESDQTAQRAETAFMNSPGHRENILRPQYTKAGIGFFRAPDGQFWVTVMFLRDMQ